MAELEVKMVTLKGMLMASAYAYGKSPEAEGWAKLKAYAEPRGYLDNPKDHPIYGFNNPPPSEGKDEYGYEFWIGVDGKAEPENDIRIILFYGGPFVVTRCRGVNNIFSAWQALFNWATDNGYEHDFRPGLEHHIANIEDPNKMILDLYLAIKEWANRA